MQKNNPLFDDLAKMATSAGGAMLEWRREMERMLQDSMEKMAGRLNLVTREEFELVRDMAAKARQENELLKARLEKLEAENPHPKKTQAQAKKPAKKE